MDLEINTFYPSKPHPGQEEVLDAIDNGTRFIQLRAGRKWRKTSLLISILFEQAILTGLTCPYVCPNRTQAKNIAWTDHVQRILNGFKLEGMPFKKNETELTVKRHCVVFQTGDFLQGMNMTTGVRTSSQRLYDLI